MDGDEQGREWEYPSPGNHDDDSDNDSVVTVIRRSPESPRTPRAATASTVQYVEDSESFIPNTPTLRANPTDLYEWNQDHWTTREFESELTFIELTILSNTHW